jgi:hypothetical protein
MTVLHDTATGYLGLFSDLRTFLTDGLGSGQNWTELRYDGTAVRSLLQAPGLSGDQEINIGMQAFGDSGTDSYAIGFFMFKSYVSAIDDLTQPECRASCITPSGMTISPFGRWPMVSD